MGNEEFCSGLFFFRFFDPMTSYWLSRVEDGPLFTSLLYFHLG